MIYELPSINYHSFRMTMKKKDITMWMNGNGNCYIPNIYPYGNGYIPSIDMLHYHEMLYSFVMEIPKTFPCGITLPFFMVMFMCNLWMDSGHEFNSPWLII